MHQGKLFVDLGPLSEEPLYVSFVFATIVVFFVAGLPLLYAGHGMVHFFSQPFALPHSCFNRRHTYLYK